MKVKKVKIIFYIFYLFKFYEKYFLNFKFNTIYVSYNLKLNRHEYNNVFAL